MTPNANTGLKAFLITLFVTGWIGFLFAMVIAQETPTGSVSGFVVLEEKGVVTGVIPGATVILSSEDVLRRTTVDADGIYRFADVPIGNYAIEARAEGLVQREYVGVTIKEGVAERAHVVMNRRQPDINVSFERSVFTPEDEIQMNVRGYTRTDQYANISLHSFNLKAYKIATARSSWEINVWDYADPEPLKEWNLALYRDSEGFFRRRITLTVPGEGAYLVRTTMGNVVRDRWISVSRIGIITKRSKDSLLVYCIDFLTKKPVEGADITLHSLSGSATGKTNSDGLFVTSPDGIDLAFAEYGKSMAVTSIDWYGESNNYAGIIYTDRPLYRPGHTVHFKGILRRRVRNFYQTPPPTQVTVRVNDPLGRTIKTIALTTNSFGTFHGECVLTPEVSLGSYYIEAHGPEDSLFGRGFEVAEYRKPEYKATISFDKDYFIAGTSITGIVEASYYFGAPVSDAEVTYMVFRSPAIYGGYECECCCDGFYSDLEAEYSGEEYGYGELVMEGEGRTDSSGRLRFRIPTQRHAEDSSYRVEVLVTDQSLRTIQTSASVLVPEGLFRLSAWTDEYIFRPGEPVKIRIQAQDHEEHPRANIAVDVHVDEETWEVRTRRYKPITSGRTTTGADGKTDFTFTAPHEGYYRVRVVARDRLGNLIDSEAWVWVAGDDFSMEGYRGPELEIVRDKKIYQIGETARIMINTTAKDAYALFTIEGKELYQYRVIRLEKSSTLIEIPVLKEYVPNAFISVCFVEGKNYVYDEVPFNVSPEYKFLDVSVTSDKEVYRPGDTARYTIRTTDTKGKPVSAEVSLGVVDESLYAIMEDRTPDLRKHFYGPAGNEVVTSYSFPSYYMGGADKDGASDKVRKYFPDTALWLPNIVTGPDGRATVKMKVPDSLTTWRATARAVTTDTDVGWSKHKCRVTKDLIVRLQTPRFFTQRDKLSIGAALHNYTARQQKVRLRLDVEGLDLQGELKRTVTIRPNQIMRLEWPVVARKAGTAVLRVYAQGETDSDAMELRVPVLPHGLNRIASANGSIERSGSFNLTIPSTAIPETLRMEVRVAPTAAGIMLGALDYLEGYEYGCVEQTVSRFTPTMVAAEALTSLGRPGRYRDPEFKKLVESCLKRLYSFQQPDGGWGWWQDESDPYMTAYVIFGMTSARRAGYHVNDESFRRGIESLRAGLEGMYESTFDLPGTRQPMQFDTLTKRAYALYVLSLNGQADAEQVEGVYEGRHVMTTYGRTLLALTLYEMGQREKADTVASEIEAESRVFKGMRYWDVDERNHRWEDSSVETTAYALRVLIRRGADPDRLEQIVRWLAMKRYRGAYWNSTKDTAAVVYALAEYVKSRPDLTVPNYRADILLNGRLQKTVTVGRENVFSKEIVVPLSASDSRVGKNTVTIRKTGTGPLYYSAVLRYYSLEEDIPSDTSGLGVTRKYLRRVLTKKGDETTVLTLRGIGKRVKIADEIICRLTISTSQDCYYVVVEDPRPAGWEPVDQLSTSGYYEGYSDEGEERWVPWVRQEVHDDKVTFFATTIPSGQWTVEYRMRVEIPGEFHSLPATAYGMYAPQFNGNSREKRVSVR